jgi:hypothetical protein
LFARRTRQRIFQDSNRTSNNPSGGWGTLRGIFNFYLPHRFTRLRVRL